MHSIPPNTPGTPTAGADADDALCWLPAHDLARRVAAREVSPVEVMQAMLARAQSVDARCNVFAHFDGDRALREARQAEQALQTAGWNRQGVTAAQAALTQDFQPLTDLRATAEYRLHAAQALLERLWLSVGGHEGKGDAGHMTEGGSPNVRSPESAAPRLEVWR